MGNYSKFFPGNLDNLATLIAFDPGGTTGWTALAVSPDWFTNPPPPNGLERESLLHIEYGQINCMTVPDGVAVEAEMHQGHPGMNTAAENYGVSKMLTLANVIFPKSAIVLEDFIVDFEQITKSRDALSPVRIISAFSHGLWADAPMGMNRNRMWIQNRSLAKTTCNDLRLRNFGLYDSSSGAHARDATRHAFYFLRDCRGNSMDAQEKRWRAWPHLFTDPVVREIQNSYPDSRKTKKLGERI